jgi:NDP-sugar pyrophosphorylase family protein
MNSGKKSIEAMILVGGKGTRLQSAVYDRPKPMADVAGKPFLEWVLLSLYKKSIRRVILCTGYMGDKVEAYFGDGSKWKLQLCYSHETSPLGTGGAVRNALDLINGDSFLVLNGDSYCRFDLNTMEKNHNSKSALATMWLVKMDDCSRYGSVILDDKGMVKSFSEKSLVAGSGLINAGIYLLERKLVENIEKDRMVSLEKDIFPSIVGHGLVGVVGGGVFVDIGTPESYASAEKILATDFTDKKKGKALSTNFTNLHENRI